jgi:tetratricopeptide (TPR) repeat protein
VAIAGARAENLGALADRLEGEVRAGANRHRSEAILVDATNLIAIGRTEQGLLEVERAVAADPTNAKAVLLLADRRRIAKDYAGAAEALRRIPADADSMVLGDAAFLSGLLCFIRTDTLGAMRDFAQSRAYRPGIARAWSAEARLRAARGDVEGAKALLRRGLEVLPGDRELTELLGRLGG